jgi:hypothetical protein
VGKGAGTVSEGEAVGRICDGDGIPQIYSIGGDVLTCTITVCFERRFTYEKIRRCGRDGIRIHEARALPLFKTGAIKPLDPPSREMIFKHKSSPHLH